MEDVFLKYFRWRWYNLFLKEKQYIIRNKYANIQLYILSFSTIGFKIFPKSTKKIWNMEHNFILIANRETSQGIIGVLRRL